MMSHKKERKRSFLSFNWPLSFLAICGLTFLVLASGCQRKNHLVSREASYSVNQNFEPRLPFEGQIIFQSDLDGDNELYLLTKKGLKKLTDNDWQDEFPRVSPDGRWVAFSANRHGNYDIFVMAMDGSRTRRLTASPYDEGELAWTADGRKIVYTEERKRMIGRSYTLWSVDLATGQRERFLADFSGSCALPDFSRREPLLTFTGKKTMGWDIYLANLENNRIINLSENGQACRSRFSPDGRWLVYVSHEADHRGEIFIIQPDGQGKRRLTVRPETYDYFPSWSPDGRYVIFCSNARSMYAHEGDWDLYLVEVATGQVELLLATPGRDVFPEWIK
jgi:Tol biopolymer transport system component